MTVRERTQVGIVGAGPAGLLLAHLLSLGGVDSRVIEVRSRAYCEKRQRAGMLEPGTVQLLRDVGLGRRLDIQGLEHDGIYLQFAGERHHLDFGELTGGRTVTIYPQTEIVKDIITARVAAGSPPEFGVSATRLSGLDTDLPVLHYRDCDDRPHELVCDAIAGCDGFHGMCRPAVPAGGLRMIAQQVYPFSWLGITALVPPSTDEVIYARHDRGFALHSMRTPEVSRLYLQVPADEDVTCWPDDRIWEELRARLRVPGWELCTGPVIDKSITAMRFFFATPMRYRRLFLAGDAAHIVPPTGAKGLNLAVADATVLASALISMLRYGKPSLADAYSSICEQRVWRSMYLSWWMTSVLHVMPRQSLLDSGLQLAQLRNLVTSQPAAGLLADLYTGGMPLRFDPSAAGSVVDLQGQHGYTPALG
jgi:p-hydroxybenzoate 3-monooxygenase